MENEFVPIINLFSLLYKDRQVRRNRERERERERDSHIEHTHVQPLPVPDASSPSCMVKMAAAGVWVVYTMKVRRGDLGWKELIINFVFPLLWLHLDQE